MIDNFTNSSISMCILFCILSILNIYVNIVFKFKYKVIYMLNLIVVFLFIFPGIILFILSTTSEGIYTALFQIVLGLVLFYLNKYKDVKKVQNILRKLF